MGGLLLAASLACGLSAAPAGSAPQPTLLPNQPAPQQPAPAPTQSAPTEVSALASPTSASVEALPTAVNDGQPTGGGGVLPAVPQPFIPESRRLTLEYPPHIRVGDADVMRLTLEVDTLGNVTPTAFVQGNIITGKIIQIPNVYDTHAVFAEARLDIAGLNVQPPDVQSESLTQGQSATFYWSIQPASAGTFRGTVWFDLRFVDKATGKESQQTISAQPVQIDANNFLGFSGGLARVAGGVGSIVGAVFGFPLADDILKWLYGRLKKS